tara:strand:- start:34 stop:438 length:405 start_codon:yes stop_codon:yes gene_type:complete
MKKILLLLILVPLLSFSQNENNKIEETLIEMEKINQQLQSDINHIKLRLRKHHEQYSTGTGFKHFGTAIIIGGLAYYGFSELKDDYSSTSRQTIIDRTHAVISVGVGFNLIGNKIRINSHKWFSKKNMPADRLN